MSVSFAPTPRRVDGQCDKKRVVQYGSTYRRTARRESSLHGNCFVIGLKSVITRQPERGARMGGGLYFHFMKDAVRQFLHYGGYLRRIGEQNIFSPKDDVIGAIYARLDSEIYRNSPARIFVQC